MPGIEFEGAGGQRDMYGSFGTADVYNTLVANGPSFRSSIVVTNPAGNADVASTVAYLLGLLMPQADGRILNRALFNPASPAAPSVKVSTVNPVSPATGLNFEVPTDPTGATEDAVLTQGSYTANLAVKGLSADGKTY